VARVALASGFPVRTPVFVVQAQSAGMRSVLDRVGVAKSSAVRDHVIEVFLTLGSASQGPFPRHSGG